MMRLDGTRRETGATDHRAEERAHLGRLSLLSLFFLSIFNHPYLLSVRVYRSLFSSSGPYIADVDLVFPPSPPLPPLV